MVMIDSYSDSSYLSDQVFCRPGVLCKRPFTSKGNFLIPIISRSPINADNDDDHYDALVDGQMKADKKYETLRNQNSIPTGSAVVVQR